MIKNKLTRKTIAVFFLLNFLSTIMPYNALYANNNGPNAPEASGFEPVNATDMVNLSSGDMSYVLPLLEVDGFPVTLSYHAGIPMEMDASWVGLGWNINTGSISRGVVSTPDDWNKGRSMKFRYYYFETESYSVDVGVGFGKAASVGVGLSWGSNKSLSGSVSASIGPISASMDTNGNYSVGLNTNILTEGLGFKDAFDAPGGSSNGFGGSLSISGNTNGGGTSVGASAGFSKNGLTAGLGVSVSGNGFGAGYSIGGGNNKTGKNKVSAGGGGSIGSFSAGDMSISTSGFYIPINIWIFNFGFGYQRQKISSKKGLNRYGFGSLYQSENSLTKADVFERDLNERNDGSLYFSTFEDLQRRNYYGDTYDQEIPQVEADFISDYRNAIEKLNFTFAGYDNYGVNASGISGNLSPIVGENTVLIGEGFEGDNTSNEQVCYQIPPFGVNVCKSINKMKVFYHNSMVRNSSTGQYSPTLATNKKLNDNNFHFAFDGQVTDVVNVSGSLKSSSNTTGVSLSDFVSKDRSYTGRPKMGSYVEVFTNKQLDADPSLMLIPNTVYNDNNILSRQSNLGYVGDGIGGYKITAPDGKTYHFAQPVYQYEKIEHNFIEIDEGLNVSGLNSNSKRTATPYATHWLLTAITGPDYIDNGNNYPDEDDLGYWLRLDHGHWSNAYSWRTPYADSDLIGVDNSITDNKNYRRYSTYNENDVDKADAGHFMQGRKDIYYLDKIVSRNQIAYFVKDLRKDGLGTDLNYEFTDTYNFGLLRGAKEEYEKAYADNPLILQAIRRNFERLETSHSVKQGVNSTMGGETILGEEYVDYSKEYLLKLDKIVIEKNLGKNNQVSSNRSTLNLGGIAAQIKADAYKSNLNNNNGTLFSRNLPIQSQTHRLHQNQKVIDVNDFSNYDYSKALKVIKFSYDYQLAKKTPNTTHTNKNTEGKLTLTQVQNFGRGTVNGANESQLYDYMPPYQFSYKRGTTNEVVFDEGNKPRKIGDSLNLYNKRDSWGFIEGNDTHGKTLADSWSLNRIQTPQGSVIDIDYEEDDYHVEAFSRRYWDNNLKFKFVKNVINGVDNFTIYVKNDNGSAYADFSKYFSVGDRVYLDLWLNLAHDNPGWDSGLRRAKIDLNVNRDICTVHSINGSNELVLKTKGNAINNDIICGYSREFARPTWVLNNYFSKSAGVPNVSQGHVNKNRGACLSKNDVPDLNNHTLTYKLLATKSPTGNSGGGLKVTKITVNDDAGAKYETSYNYNAPVNGTGVGLTSRSSGITSFYPVYGTKFVPYQNELPGPGVMYEWVTMEAKGYDAAGRSLPTEKTRYHFYTLQPNFHIFDPNFEMKDKDGEILFKATVQNKNISQPYVTAKDINIEKNLAKIGQLISIEKFNTEGQLMNKTVNSYGNKQGSFKETFNSMKSVYKYHYPDEGDDQHKYLHRQLKGRFLSLSSKTEHGKVLNKVSTTTPYGTSSIEYENPDPYLGTYRTSVRSMADGSIVKETKIPAYEVYPEMGSKKVNTTNRNMLTQEAMHINSVAVGEGSSRIMKTTSASVTTWNKEWTYRNEVGVESSPTNDSEKIWRKHKNFVWKGSLDEDGTYGRLLSKYDFKWGLDATQTNEEWQNVSEITRYTNYSLPIETRDINDNYASSKMAEGFSKVIAGGNARYTEMYASGAEHVFNNNQFDGEVEGANYRDNTHVHTGNYAVKLTDASQKGFKVQAMSGLNDKDFTKDLRPGKYKVSAWVYNGVKLQNSFDLMVGTVAKKPDEILQAGTWALCNYYIDILPNTNTEIYFRNNNYSYGIYIDDFRMHPIVSSMNTYVYNQTTDELQFILDGNNLATEFKYDKAGRLCRTYKEVVNQGQQRGGFKLVNEYKYQYKNNTSSSANCNCCDN